jgi:DNA-binding transcriptional LysR family regulator
MNEHPGVEIDIVYSDRVTDLVAEGFELAIRIGSLRDSTLIARKIAEVSDVVCAAPSLIERHGMPAHPDDLRGWPALLYTASDRSPMWRYRAPDGTEGVLPLDVRMRANNGGVLRDAGIAGMGVIREPSFIVYKAIERGQLKVILPGYRWSELAIYAVYPQTRHLSARARAAIWCLFPQILYLNSPVKVKRPLCGLKHT